jgi:4-aminobutyrate aminotransferase-like enzyme
VASAVGIAAIRQILDEGIVEASRARGAQVMGRLRELQSRLPIIGDVRGEGLLIGAELVRDPVTRERFPAEVNLGIRVREAARRRGLLLRASHWMVAFAPPLTITAAEVDELMDIFEASLQDVLGTAAPERATTAGVGGRASA